MKKIKEKKRLHFWCPNCRFYWRTDEYTLNSYPIVEKYDHLAICPECGQKTEEVPHYYANLKKMHLNAQGPRTKAGKQASSMNNFKTGMYSKKVNRLAPALFGKYAQCKNCEYTEMCQIGNMKYCPFYLGTMLRFISAYQEGRVEDLKEFAGLQQGKTQMIIEMMTDAMFDKGVLLEEIDKNGVINYKANPLIKQYPAMIETAGYSSNQNKMNPKTAEEKEQVPGGGHLQKEDGLDYIARLSVSMAKAVAGIAKAEEKRKQDKFAVADTDLSEADLKIDTDVENPFKK